MKLLVEVEGNNRKRLTARMTPAPTFANDANDQVSLPILRCAQVRLDTNGPAT